MPINEAERTKAESDRYRQVCFDEFFPNDDLELIQCPAFPPTSGWDLSMDNPQLVPLTTTDLEPVTPVPVKRAKCNSSDYFLAQTSAHTRDHFQGQFDEFTSRANLGQKRENFLAGICRYIGKVLKFCVMAETQGFDEAFHQLLTLHRVIKNPKHVKVPANESSRWLYMELYQSFLHISTRTVMTQVMLELLHSTRSYNIEFQRKFYSSEDARKFYYATIQFFDGFGLEGEGILLKQTLRVKPPPLFLKQQMLYGYLYSLGLLPFDGFHFSTTFMITKFTD